MKLLFSFALLLGASAQAQTTVPKTPQKIVQTSGASQSALRVSGDVVKPRVWTLQQLQAAGPVQTIRTTLKSQPFQARGVALWPLLEAAAPKLDPKTKHSEARFIVLARGKDAYLTSFAWPDLMPDVGGKGAFLIWEANGEPLGAKNGPFRLVILGDKKPMRWVYGLVGLEIYDAKRLSRETRPQNPKAN